VVARPALQEMLGTQADQLVGALDRLTSPRYFCWARQEEVSFSVG
jgi:hypothetical protein